MDAQPKLQIFVSSTFADLQAERQAAVEMILRMGHIPAGMELFAAESRPQLEIIKDWIDESDAFLLILGGRYGSIEPDSGKSYVEIEYRHALELGRPAFALVLSEHFVDAKVNRAGKSALELSYPTELRDFRSFVLSKLVRIVNDEAELKIAVMEGIQNITRKRKGGMGWVRADTASMSPTSSTGNRPTVG